MARCFDRNGVIRVPDPRRLDEGYKRYKKGYEVRLVLLTQEELDRVKVLVSSVGIKFGAHYRKGLRYVLPIYGKRDVDRFIACVSAKQGPGVPPVGRVSNEEPAPGHGP